MRVLLLSQYFPPEVGATQARAFEMARHLVRAGHSVTVITEVPNHPSGIIRPRYRRRLWVRESIEGIDVIRVWVKATPRKTLRSRLWMYGTYMLGACVAGVLMARGRFDVVYATSPPLPVGGAGIFLSWIRRAPLIFEVRDLWPESAIALGALQSARARRVATRLEEACYRRAAGIVVVTRGIRDRIVERGVRAEKLTLIRNGANVEQFVFRPEGRTRVRAELGVGDDTFVVAYVGVHGLAQGLEHLVAAADRLRDDASVRFLLVGAGPRKVRLRMQVESLGLSNVILHDECARDEAPDFLSAADAVVVPLLDLPLFRGALPSKMFDAWACERPLIVAIRGEAEDIVNEAGGGVVVEPEDPDALVDAIRELQADPEQRATMGAAGRRKTIADHSRAGLASAFIDWLEARVRR